MSEEIKKITQQIFDTANKNQFTGYDPFDGLNSIFIKKFSFIENTVFGLVWLQFFKRSPFKVLRKLAFIPKTRNPKGIALYILGTIENLRINFDQKNLNTVIELADWLIENRSPKNKWSDYAWGYNFPWKARAFFVPKGKPNIITTVYVGISLFELTKFLKEASIESKKTQIYEKAFININSHILKHHLESRRDSDGQIISYFTYIPGEKAFVHNASLWGAAYIAMTYKHEKSSSLRNKYKDIVRRVAYYSTSKQLEDGSWLYGNNNHHKFIDSFHTGYNLEALKIIQSNIDGLFLDNYIEKGYKYYRENFITDGGIVKYYNNNKFPLDMHSVSQAIITILLIDRSDKKFELVEEIINKSIIDMYIKKTHTFAYQINKFYTNKMNYDRWTHAWAYYSFMRYLNTKNQNK